MSKVKSYFLKGFNKTLYFISFVIIFGLLLSNGCTKKEILPEDKFVEVYVDILVAEDTTSEISISADSLKAIVLKKHNISDRVYNNTLEFYNETEKKWEQFFVKAEAYVEQLKTKKED